MDKAAAAAATAVSADSTPPPKPSEKVHDDMAHEGFGTSKETLARQMKEESSKPAHIFPAFSNVLTSIADYTTFLNRHTTHKG